MKSLNEKIENIKIVKIQKSKNGYALNIEYDEKNDPREKLFKYIVKSKWSLLEMTPKSENLEDIFRKLTGNKN